MSHRLTIKGQVTIPKAIRDYLGLREGNSSVEFEIAPDGTVRVAKAKAQGECAVREEALQANSRSRRVTRSQRSGAPARAASHRGVLSLLAGGI